MNEYIDLNQKETTSSVEITKLASVEELYIYQPKLMENVDIAHGCQIKEEIDSLKTKKDVIHEYSSRKVLLPNSVSKQELDDLGLVEFEDYLYEKYVNKKLVILYGNCHTSVISEYLKKCKEFTKQHFLYEIKPIHTIENVKYFDDPIFKYCDIFIHQSIQRKNRYGEAYSSEKIIARLNKKCQKIAIPNVYRLPMCFFPQYSKEPELKKLDGSTVFFRDSLLDRAAEKQWLSRKASYDYWMVQHFEKTELEKSVQLFFEKVEQREREWDIKCLDFIRENYQKQQLFYDPNHPTNFFLKYVTEKILDFLKVEYDKNNFSSTEPLPLSGYEMPILPEVKEKLGMTFEAEDEMRVYSYCKVKMGKMNGYRDYVKQYLACAWQNPNVKLWYKCWQLVIWSGMKLYNSVGRIVQHNKKRRVQ